MEYNDKESHTYMQPDSWLVDYELRLRSYRESFGHDNVIVIDYDREIEKHGSVLPSFIDRIGAAQEFMPDEWEGLWKNKS